jgi:hypothetical protein
VSDRVEGEGGKREVSPLLFFDARGDLSGASVEATNPEEGSPWGRHGFPHASEPKASEAVA